MALEEAERRRRRTTIPNMEATSSTTRAAWQKKMIFQGHHGQDRLDQNWSSVIEELQNVSAAPLEKKFRDLLISHSIAPIELEPLITKQHKTIVDGDAIDIVAKDDGIQPAELKIWPVELIPRKAVTELQSTTEHMIASGCLQECLRAYKSVRKSVVNASFQSLGIENDVQAFEGLAIPESKLRERVRAARDFMRILLPSEKKLCKQIFAGIDEMDACFWEITEGPVIQLLNFAKLMGSRERSPENLFQFLELHEALMDLLLDIKMIFYSKLADPIPILAVEVSSTLAKAAREAFSAFENEVLHWHPESPDLAGGNIHPSTRYVMKCVRLMIFDHKKTLTELITWKPSTGSMHAEPSSTDFPELEGKDPLGIHLLWIIVVLQFNLEGKSIHCNDASLAHLFMMNNCHYIVQKIEGCQELKDTIGEYYLRKLTGKCWRASRNYQRTTLAGLLHCFRGEGLLVSGSSSSGVSKVALRERMKTFNAMFDKVHRTQATWFVPDNQLREELRISINEKLIQAYRMFIGLYCNHMKVNYIKYTAEDLENAVFDLFEGSHPQGRGDSEGA
uniref:Exocyst subunit Exo70 family protein n=1 Tax=Rhizophora mucronata TaxID=61149 RepID=A0A2P2NI66_RHIMU